MPRLESDEHKKLTAFLDFFSPQGSLREHLRRGAGSQGRHPPRALRLPLDGVQDLQAGGVQAESRWDAGAGGAEGLRANPVDSHRSAGARPR